MKVYISILSCLIPIFLLAQNPRFAPNFPEKGLLHTPLGVGKAEVYAGLIQADGKILVCGGVRRQAAVNNPGSFMYPDRNYLLVRHLPNGDPDSSFGNAGILSIDNKDGDEFFYKINVDISGHIYLLGNGNNNTYMVKLLLNGTLDQDFGEGGFLKIYGRESDGSIRDMLVKPDGKILFCGSESSDFFLFQLFTDGSPDLTFGDQGTTYHSLTTDGLGDDALTLALQNNGRILVGGVSDVTPTVLAFTADGDLDISFNQTGFTQVQSPDYQGRFEQLHVFDDQSFIAVGSENGGNRKAMFAAFEPDGQPDTNRFGTQVIKPDTDQEQNFRSMAVSPKEEIYYQSFFNEKFLLTKLTPQGQLDSTFGFEGQILFTLENQPCYANNVMLQPSGKIVMSGTCPPAYNLVCLDSVGRLDPYFQQTGFINRKVKDGGSTIWKLHQLKDQTHVGIGHSYYWQVKETGLQSEVIPQGHIWKFDSNGDLDADFALRYHPGGRLIADIAESDDGDYILAGQTFTKSNVTESQSYITKINPSGEIDSTFGRQGTVSLNDHIPSINDLRIFDIDVREDQKIWVVFQQIEFFGLNDIRGPILLTRLLPNGDFDPDFFNGGSTTLIEHITPSEITESVSLTDGGLLISGYAPNIGGIVPGLFVLKVSENGRKESDGVGFSNSNTIAGAKIVQKPNGEIFQGGSVDGEFKLLEYTAKGLLNPAFGTASLGSEMGSITFSDMALAPNGDVIMLGYVDNWATARYEAVVACFDGFGKTKEEFGENGIFTFHLETTYTYPETISMDARGNFSVSGSAGAEAFHMRFLSDLHLDDPDSLPSNSVEKPIVYPNPIHDQIANIRYTLTSDQLVRIRLLDLQGRQFYKVFEEQQLAGTYSRRLELPFQSRGPNWSQNRNLTAGYYLLHIQTGETSNYIKVQIIPR